MQIFVVGSIIYTASKLDKKRFNNQITEARIILDCLNGKNGWGKHPLAKMYKDCKGWLELYIEVFRSFKASNIDIANKISEEAEKVKPSWMDQKFYDRHKSRLFTKNPNYYNEWGYLGKSYSNWYIVDGVWKEYIQKIKGTD